MSNTNASTPILPLLGLMLIGFKIGGVIDWSWWWVLLPLYAPVILLIAGLAILVMQSRK
jgi:membrane protein DedA with SNARE-associated domain